jgi:hypothetical protein
MRYMKYASLTLQTIRDFNLTDPTVRTQLRKRYGDQLPLSAPVIAPVSMFRSPLLVTIAERWSKGLRLATPCVLPRATCKEDIAIVPSQNLPLATP